MGIEIWYKDDGDVKRDYAWLEQMGWYVKGARSLLDGSLVSSGFTESHRAENKYENIGNVLHRHLTILPICVSDN